MGIINMATASEKYNDHEVRLRVMEKLSELIVNKLDHLDNKMDNQFKWIVGTVIIGIFGLIATKFF
jgi:hypothetical protein